MELLYMSQDLKAGQLNNSFNKIENCKVTKPSWKGNNTYGDTFFVEKRQGIKEDTRNMPDGMLVDTITLDEVEYLLLRDSGDLEVAYDDGVNFTGFGITQTYGDDTPIRFVKGKSAKGEFTEEVLIEDAYFDIHDAGAWSIGTTYDLDNIVQYSGIDYISIKEENIGNQPDTSTEYWEEYVTDESGYDISDPATIEYRDVYNGSYLKLKLKKTAIRDTAITGNFVFFDNNNSNLQGVVAEIYYTATTYVDLDGNTQSLAADEVYVYIRETNEAGTRPYTGEQVSICTEVGFIPLIATTDKVVALHLEYTAGDVSGVKEVTLYECEGSDEIVDLIEYNGALFILTKDKILFSRVLLISNINFYPLDAFLNVGGLEKLVAFGKVMIAFGSNNAVLTPVVGTEGTEGYLYNHLHYNENLYSKYSVVSAMGSLYVLQDDKQFVQLDIGSENNIDYQVKITNVIPNVRGMFEFVTGEVYMNEWDRQIRIIDKQSSISYYYKFDIEYKHWTTGNYTIAFYKIEDYLYGQGLFEFNDNFFDATDTYFDQVVGFDFGGDDLHTLKEVIMVKLILGLNEDLLDYELVVQYQLAGIIQTKTIDLKNYPVNTLISGGDEGLGDSLIGSTLLGEGEGTATQTIGNFVSVTVGIGITASVFSFQLKSKENGFIYGGSIIGYMNKIPTMTEFNYKH